MLAMNKLSPPNFALIWLDSVRPHAGGLICASSASCYRGTMERMNRQHPRMRWTRFVRNWFIVCAVCVCVLCKMPARLMMCLCFIIVLICKCDTERIFGQHLSTCLSRLCKICHFAISRFVRRCFWYIKVQNLPIGIITESAVYQTIRNCFVLTNI